MHNYFIAPATPESGELGFPSLRTGWQHVQTTVLKLSLNHSRILSREIAGHVGVLVSGSGTLSLFTVVHY